MSGSCKYKQKERKCVSIPKFVTSENHTSLKNIMQQLKLSLSLICCSYESSGALLDSCIPYLGV